MTEQATATDVQIYRADHGAEHPYFVQRRKTAQDESLSFEARGVISYLLSKPDDWTINKVELCQAGSVGRDKMNRIIHELVTAGYMVKTQPRAHKGHFAETVLALYECPQSPLTEKPSTVKPSTVNPHLHSTESLQSTENKEGSKDIAATPLAPVFQYDEPIGPELPATRQPTDHQLMFQAVCDALRLDVDTLTKDRKGTIGKTATQLRGAKAKPENMRGFIRWLKAKAEKDEWSGDVTENAMRKYWPDYAKTIKALVVQHCPAPDWMVKAGLLDDDDSLVEDEAA